MHAFIFKEFPIRGEKFNMFKNVFIFFFLENQFCTKVFRSFWVSRQVPPARSAHSPPCIKEISGNPPMFPLQEVNGSE